MKKIIEWIIKKLDLKQCERCGSFEVKRGHYTRGWNNYCGQASGDTGWHCFDCGFIKWEKTYDEYVKGLPNWVTPYKDRKP